MYKKLTMKVDYVIEDNHVGILGYIDAVNSAIEMRFPLRVTNFDNNEHKKNVRILLTSLDLRLKTVTILVPEEEMNFFTLDDNKLILNCRKLRPRQTDVDKSCIKYIDSVTVSK